VLHISCVFALDPSPAVGFFLTMGMLSIGTHTRAHARTHAWLQTGAELLAAEGQAAVDNGAALQAFAQSYQKKRLAMKVMPRPRSQVTHRTAMLMKAACHPCGPACSTQH
jgi:hypothetical protein